MLVAGTGSMYIALHVVDFLFQEELQKNRKHSNNTFMGIGNLSAGEKAEDSLRDSLRPPAKWEFSTNAVSKWKPVNLWFKQCANSADHSGSMGGI